MTENSIKISRFPLFKKDVFKNNPSLFTPFFRNTPEALKKRYQKAQNRLPEFENTMQWSMISGRGFCGATHPGAGKSFSKIMIGSEYSIYDSDCIYINPSRNIFAISDPLGMTTFSRELFEDMDKHLKTTSDRDVGRLINRLKQNIRPNERATLTLLSVDKNQSASITPKAYAFIAGDTYLFHGNFRQKKIVRVRGQDAFIGRLSSYLEPIELDIWRGAEITKSDSSLKVYDENHDLVKEELMPDGRTKLILKEKSSGAIIQKFVE